jgi:hypothetical protein
MKISNSLKHSSAPAQRTPKQILERYIATMQQIVKGYRLDDMNNLHPKLHSDMIAALSNAEARLHAPDATSESFEPHLKSLQMEIAPILKNKFSTTDVSTIVANIPASSADQPPQPAPRRDNKIADFVDGAFASAKPARSITDTQKFDNLKQMIRTEQPRASSSSAIRKAYATTPTHYNMDQVSESYYRNNVNKEAAVRLTSSIGKTIEITGSTDLTRAFQRMEMVCSRNGVRRDFQSQRFHVRRGLLKKQMRMIRWRNLFKEGFIAECGRVRRMRRQGW